MNHELPRLDKTSLSVSFLEDETAEKAFWQSKGPADRLNAIELNRRMVYGRNRSSSRLQRLLETADFPRR
jgi:hypothetical protein